MCYNVIVTVYFFESNRKDKMEILSISTNYVTNPNPSNCLACSTPAVLR